MSNNITELPLLLNNITKNFSGDTMNLTIENNTKNYISTLNNFVPQILTTVKQTTNPPITRLVENITAGDITENNIEYTTSRIEITDNSNLKFLFVPLAVLVTVLLLSALVFMLARKRKIDNLRHRLMPLYNFDPSDEFENDWETELLEETYERRINYKGYKTMEFQSDSNISN